MFDKKRFAQIIKNISDTYDNQREFAEKSEINRTYLSQYMNMKLDEPPKPKILKKLSTASSGIISYTELMIICGYFQEPKKELENYISIVFKKISNYSTNVSIIKTLLNSFINYQNDLIDSFILEDKGKVKNVLNYIESSRVSMPFFMMLHDSLVNYLILCNIVENNIDLLINWNDETEISSYLDSFSSPILFTFKSKHFKVCENINNEHIIDIIKQYGICLNYAFSSQYTHGKNSFSQYYMCPVYGRISAGQPNWAEECIEGRIPIDPDMMNIVNPEECYFLRVHRKKYG